MSSARSAEQPVQLLVGRDAELARIDELLAGFANGDRSRIAISGEPGSGKSALLQQLRARADARGLRVVDGRADELDREVELGLVLDAFEDELERLGPADRSALGPIRLAELARAFPSFASGATSGTPTGSAPAIIGAGLSRALAAALERIAAAAPLVVVLDDLQWADDRSLALVARLLRRPPHGLLPVIAYRSGHVPDLLARAVGVTSADGAVHHLELGPLDAEAAAPLLDALPPARADAILAASGGNPFYLSALAGAARAGGEDVPATVRAAVVGELSRMSEPARDMVRAAAMLGTTFDPELAGEVAELAPAQRDATLDELVRGELLRMADVPERYAFQRPIVATVARDWTGDAWRTAAHARAADRLALDGAPIAERARHVEQSARTGDRDAAQLLRTAGAEAASDDPLGAARWFGAAQRLLAPDADPLERLPLLLERATALAGRGDVAALREPLGELFALLPHLGAEQRAQALAPLAQVEELLARRGEPARRAEEDATGVVELHILLAVAQWHGRDWSAMARTARDAREHLFDVEVDADLRAQLAALASIAERQLGRTSTARAALAEAEWIIDRGARVDGRLRALSHLVMACIGLDRFESALAYDQQLLAGGRASMEEWFVVRALATTASTLMTLGRLDEAERASREALDAATAANPQGLLWANGIRCRIASMRGDRAAAVEHGERAVAAYAQVPSAIDAVLAPAFLAEARIADGDLDRGVADLVEAAGGLQLELLSPTWRPWCAALLAEAELERGDVAAARAWGARTAELAAAVGSTTARAHADRVRGLLLLEEGDARAAAEAAEAAADAYCAIGLRLDAAVAQGLAGSAQAQAGEREAGLALLRAAHDTLATAGAVLARDRVAERLRRLGQRVPGRGRPAPRPAHGAAALTPREQEIADLVAQGATNRQVAEQLVISTKTVESHLSRVFAKLGVNSRTAAVHALATRGAET